MNLTINKIKYFEGWGLAIWRASYVHRDEGAHRWAKRVIKMKKANKNSRVKTFDMQKHVFSSIAYWHFFPTKL